MPSANWPLQATIGLLLSLLSTLALAIPAPPTATDQPARLELRGDDGEVTPALLEATEVQFDISGLLVRTQVIQTYHNSGNDWMEGIYTYPLPENAAVDHLRMRIGERVIEGQIREREAARKTYTQAKQNGQRASLIEQQRPNIFTTAVANIGPGERVVIEIEYQQLARYDSGQFRLRFPLTILPRYIPGRPLQPGAARPADRGDATATGTVTELSVRQKPQPNAVVLGGTAFGWAPATDQVADAPLITPPVAAPGEVLRHRVSLSARLKAGIALQQITSSYHPVAVERPSTSEARVTLAERYVRPDRDFELVWTPVASATPQAALLSHDLDGHHYGILMVVPPSGERRTPPLPTALTLVLDISGSMHGDSIRQAKRSLERAIASLRDQDRFNLIVFNNRSTALWAAPQSATASNRQQALTFIDSLEAEGGTEMAGAIRRALSQPPQPGYLPQVLFITDGAVGNEAALFNLIETQLGQQRFYTVGIGSAPNSHFMTKAAQLGRGTFTYIGDTGEVQAKMDALLAKLATPQLTDIRVASPTALDSYPRQIPDLYAGEPLLLSFRADQLPPSLTLSGRLGEQRWQQVFQLQAGGGNPAVPVLWARSRIDELMDRHHSAQGADQPVLRQQVIDTALAHHLVSRFTSLVAVDVTPVRPAGTPLRSQTEKTLLPKGTSHQKIFGLAKTATPAPLQILTGLLLLLLALWVYRLGGRGTRPVPAHG